VRQELRQLGDDTAATLLRLAPSRGNADDDVSKEPTCAIAERSFSLRERENIRRTIVSPVPVVEPLNAVVSRKKHRKLGARHLERVEHRFGSARHVCTPYPAIGATFDNEPDRHQVTDLLPGPYASAAPV
jgi:hypothetical protein